MKRGFGIITAIIFMVTIALLGILTLSLSSQTQKQSTDNYLKYQAELLLRNATEFAILAVSSHEINNANKCLKEIKIDFPGKESDNNDIFKTKIYIRYFLTEPEYDFCKNQTFDGFAENNKVAYRINELQTHSTIMIDAMVEVKEGFVSEPIRVHRRTIQKI